MDKQKALDSKYTWFYSEGGTFLHYVPEADREGVFWEKACSGVLLHLRGHFLYCPLRSLTRVTFFDTYVNS